MTASEITKSGKIRDLSRAWDMFRLYAQHDGYGSASGAASEPSRVTLAETGLVMTNSNRPAAAGLSSASKSVKF